MRRDEHSFRCRRRAAVAGSRASEGEFRATRQMVKVSHVPPPSPCESEPRRASWTRWFPRVCQGLGDLLVLPPAEVRANSMASRWRSERPLRAARTWSAWSATSLAHRDGCRWRYSTLPCGAAGPDGRGSTDKASGREWLQRLEPNLWPVQIGRPDATPNKDFLSELLRCLLSSGPRVTTKQDRAGWS